jgi:hypothetical protein
MPIGLSPNHFVWISLDIDADIPEEKRPAFRCRFPSTDHVKRIEAYLDEAAGAADNTKATAILDKAILVRIDGWRNINDEAGKPVDFSESALGNLTYLEKQELAAKSVTKTALAELDRKKLPSASASAGEQSARDAAVVNAPTVPPK